MRIACWSVKGGSGTTVVTAGLALLSARAGPVTLVDLEGELPAVLGLAEPIGPGVADWLRAGAHPPESLDRLRVAAGAGIELLPLGHGPLPNEPGAGEALAIQLGRGEGTCIIDAGLQPSGARAALVEASDLSLLVLRPCYLALRRVQAQPLRPDGVVVVREPGRALSATDVADVLGVPVRAEIALDPTIARAVDAGLLACRLPRPGTRIAERGMSERSALDDVVHARVVADPDDDVGTAARRHALAVAPLLHGAELEQLVERVVHRALGLGPLQPLLADPAVSEVMVNAGRDVWIERHGEVVRASVELEPATVSHLIERVVAPLGRRIDRSSPIVDGRLGDGTRVHAIVPPVAIDGPCLTLRRFAHHAVPLTAFASAAVVGLLRWAVDARMNVVVSGPTSAGKTTLLNALAAQIGPGERLITIEDAAELRLEGDHVVRLEARPPSQDGAGAITIRDLVRAALRMRPDRLVVGEVRGPEALDMVMALSTGHDGSLSTCHANSALDALRRLEVMVLQGGGELPFAAVRDVVQAAIDLIVHVGRGAAGHRRIIEVVEVLPPADGSGSRVRLLASGDAVVAGPTRAERRAGGVPSRVWPT